MRIGVIVGSHRKESESAKVGRFLSKVLSARDGVSTWTLDLGKTPLPLWDEALWSNGPQWSMMPELKSELDACDGFVVVAPEWHGMVPAALKNFFLAVGRDRRAFSQTRAPLRCLSGRRRLLCDRRTADEQL